MTFFRSTALMACGVAVLAAGLSSPPAAAKAPEPALVPTQESRLDANPPATASKKTCEPDGSKADGDVDCVTLRIASDKWLPGFEEKIRFRGKAHPSMRRALGARVVIQRAADGGLWTDHGEKWRKVGTAKIGRNGNFSASFKVSRAGSHTFRAKLRTKASTWMPTVKSANSVGPSGMVVDAPGYALSASASAMVGVPYYAFEIHNLSGHELNASCRALGIGPNLTGTYSGASSFTRLAMNSDGAEPEPYRCVFPILPNSDGNFYAGTFQLQQADPLFGEGSIYNFYPSDTNSTNDNQCVETGLPTGFNGGVQTNLPIKPNDIVRVDISTDGGYGYSGTMNFSNGQQCVFGMYTAFQDSDAPSGGAPMATIEGSGVYFLAASDRTRKLPAAPNQVPAYLFIVKGGLSPSVFAKISDASASGRPQNPDLWNAPYAVDNVTQGFEQESCDWSTPLPRSIAALGTVNIRPQCR